MHLLLTFFKSGPFAQYGNSGENETNFLFHTENFGFLSK